MHEDFFKILFNKGLTKIIHEKTRSHHTTPTNPIMGENHANRALSGNTKIPHQLEIRNHIPQDAL
jgi:hypothetical protein